MNVLAFARDLPKVELHCHLEGAARPSTIADLARANGVTLPTDDPVELFEFTDLDHDPDRVGYDADTIEDIALDPIDASWAPADEQAALRERFLTEMAALREQHGLAPRYV